MNPIYNLLESYCAQYNELRERNDDISNLAFHRGHGLCLQVPQEWSLLDAVVDITKSKRFKTVCIVYPTAVCFRDVDTLLDQAMTSYLSWHEVYTAMQMASSDIRHIKRVKSMLDVELVIGLDPPALDGIEDQVRGCVAGCLLILSQGE